MAGEASATVSVYVLEHDEVLDSGLLSSLAPWREGEWRRMVEFRDSSARTSYCLARLLARKAIASVTGREEPGIDFLHGEQGKPYLAPPSPAFNWSHARGCVLLALSSRGDLGADIESRGRILSDYLDISRRFFAADEHEWVRAGGEGEGSERFLSLFVQKEAYLKMKGSGLSGSLPDAEASLRLPPHRTARAALFLAGASSGYLGAVVHGGPGAAEFRFYSSRFDPAAGIAPLGEWARIG